MPRPRSAMRKIRELLRLHLGEVPFSIHMPGRVEPCPLLCLEGDVGPRLVGVTREQKALRDAKVCIVPGESGCVDQVGLGFDWWRPVSRGEIYYDTGDPYVKLRWEVARTA